MRSRNIKPALFKNELLGEADPLLTILFTGLWCMADRNGKLEDRPKRIKAEIFPYRDLPNNNGTTSGIDGLITELVQLGFIERYSVEDVGVIRVLSFDKHQHPHKQEKESDLPDRPENTSLEESSVINRNNNGTTSESVGLIPDSLNLIPDSCEGGNGFQPIPHTQIPPDAPNVYQYMMTRNLNEQEAEIEAQKFTDFYKTKEKRRWKIYQAKLQRD